MSAGMTVHAPGLLTTVQDLGRWGHQDVGVPVGGAMDPFAHRLANALVANEPLAATLEITLTGPTLEFDAATTFAVAGALFDLFLDDQAVPADLVVHARAGAILRFGARHRGARAYLAVAGGFAVPSLLGSRSTHVPTRMGGFRGRPLRRGDHLPVGASATPAAAEHQRLMMAVASERAPDADLHDARVRVLAGPQHDRFADDALERLCAHSYSIDHASDRMGYRLTGDVIMRVTAAEMISDATPIGSIQVPANGQPILLMADRQTTGGYPKLATVISADIGIAAQVAPGECLRFQMCDRSDALAALIARERQLMTLESRVA